MGSRIKMQKQTIRSSSLRKHLVAMVRALLPIVGLVVIFLLFNVLTDFRMMGNMSLAFSQVYVDR